MSNKELLEQLEQETAKADLPLKDTATNLVFGKGNPDTDILFIGEAPGEQEDLQGIPFVGRAGKELDKQLHKIGLTLEDVYIANILKYRPPKNRDPNPDEIKAHTPYLVKQIQVIKPKVIITLGNYATKFVLAGFSEDGMKKIQGVSQLHGKPTQITVDTQTLTIVPCYHPAAMMYNPKIRPAFEADMLAVANFLGLEIKEAQGQATLGLFTK